MVIILCWSVADKPSDIPLKKTDCPFPMGSRSVANSFLISGMSCVYFCFSGLVIVWFEPAQVLHDPIVL